MVDPTDGRHPIELLADDFTQRCRQGQTPTVDEYAQRHPELAADIQALFPTIAAVERLKAVGSDSNDRPLELRVDKLEQLGDFRIVREIGRGGMGIVYEAEQQSLGRRVAVKVFPRKALADSRHVLRFQREARTTARLHHTNIVPVFGFGEQDGIPYYVMQFIPGIGLDQVIHELQLLLHESNTSSPGSTTLVKASASEADDGQRRSASQTAAWGMITGSFVMSPPDGGSGSTSGVTGDKERSSSPASSPTPDAMPGRIPGNGGLVRHRSRSVVPSAYWRSVAHVGVQVAEALDHAHSQGTCHRDIKPANLLLDEHGTVWVTDFGLAGVLAQERLSRSGDIVGTLRYMAPEQLLGTFDARSDIHSLGLTLYELLLLRCAHKDVDRNAIIQRVAEGELAPLRKTCPAVPRDLETIVLKATARSPGHRYQTARELANDLRNYLDDRPIRARRVGPVEQLWRWSRRNPAVASLSALLLFVVLASLATIGAKWREAEVEKQRAQDESRRAESNLSLALDSMNRISESCAANWMAHPADPQGGDEDRTVRFRPVISEDMIVILEDTLRFYDQFAKQNAGNARLRRDTANAYARVGDIHDRLGHVQQAEAAYRQAADMIESERRLHPTDAALAAQVAATRNQLGRFLEKTGHLEDAQYQYRLVRQILASKTSNSPECRFELASACGNLGSLSWRLWRPGEAVSNLRQASELLQQLVREQPDRAEFRLALARAYLSHVPYAPGGRRVEEVAQWHSQAMEILHDLVNSFPEVPDYRCELSEWLIITSNRGPAAEDRAKAETQLREAVELVREIADEYPMVPRYRTALAWSLQRLGRLLQQSNRREEAEPIQSKAVELYTSLWTRFPNIFAYQFFLATTLHAHGETLRELDRLPESRQCLERAVAETESYLRSNPNLPMGRATLALQYHSLEETLRQLDEVSQADAAARKAHEIQAELARKRRPWPSPPPVTPSNSPATD